MTRTDVGESFAEDPLTRAGQSVVAPRDVPLGGLRSMTVRRTLPNRERSTIGPWCFLDHYGPDRVDDTGGMSVAPHPHTGLQTVSWLFSGAIEHHDSTGFHTIVEPGQLNLMTAGRGIQHSEVSTVDTTVLHGVQLWVALPNSARHQRPHCDLSRALSWADESASIQLITGSLPDIGAVDAPTYWPMMAAQLDLQPGAELVLTADPDFEYGLLVDSGEVVFGDTPIPEHHLGYQPAGATQLTLRASTSPLRAILIGGTPFEEPLVMWWNFVGRDHADILQARTEWQEGLETGSTRFGHLAHMPALPAPEMPSVRLKPRRASRQAP